jgi:hypothetical protein
MSNTYPRCLVIIVSKEKPLRLREKRRKTLKLNKGNPLRLVLDVIVNNINNINSSNSNNSNNSNNRMHRWKSRRRRRSKSSPIHRESLKIKA